MCSPPVLLALNSAGDPVVDLSCCGDVEAQ